MPAFPSQNPSDFGKKRVIYMAGKEQSPSLFGAEGRQIKSSGEAIATAKPQEPSFGEFAGRRIKKRLGKSSVGRAILLTLYS